MANKTGSCLVTQVKREPNNGQQQLSAFNTRLEEEKYTSTLNLKVKVLTPCVKAVKPSQQLFFFCATNKIKYEGSVFVFSTEN